MILEFTKFTNYGLVLCEMNSLHVNRIRQLYVIHVHVFEKSNEGISVLYGNVAGIIGNVKY